MEKSLQNKVRQIVQKLGFVPSRRYASQVPFFAQVVEEVESSGTTWEAATNDPQIVTSLKVKIPSLAQKRGAAQIYLRERTLNLSKPGARKTLTSLAAIPLIRDRHPDAKTFVCCPGYIVPVWIREITKTLPSLRTTVITKTNRSRSLDQIAEDGFDIVIVSTDMLYQRSTLNYRALDVESEQKRAYRELRQILTTPQTALDYLEDNFGSKHRKKWEERFEKKSHSVLDMIDYIALEQVKSQIDPINAVLESSTFNGESPFYAIVDEFHGLVHQGKRAKAVSSIVRNAKWRHLMSGTGIPTNPTSDLNMAAYMLGFVEDPKDFRAAVHRDLRGVRAFIDMHALHPTYTLEDIDTEVPAPLVQEVSHNLNPAQVLVQRALMNASGFEAREKYLLMSYLLLDPAKLRRDSICADSASNDMKDNWINFLNENTDVEKILDHAQSSRYESLDQVVHAARPDDKFLAFTHFANEVTEVIAQRYSELGSIAISSELDSMPKEIALTAEEQEYAFRNGLKAVYRSELTPTLREELGIPANEIFDLSDRDAVLIEAMTNPRIRFIASTYGCLREGVDAKEVTHILEVEPTTVPGWLEQSRARAVRSGQRKQIRITSFSAADSLDSGKIELRTRREKINNRCMTDTSLSRAEIEDFQALSKRPENIFDVQKHLNLSSASLVGLILSRVQDSSPEDFFESMNTAENAFKFASHYSFAWNHSNSANGARLVNQLVREARSDRPFTSALDLGCGPLAFERASNGLCTNVDINRYQLEFGLSACQFTQGIYLLGNVANLDHVVRLSDTEDVVFNPAKRYDLGFALPESHYDTVIGSCLVYLFNANTMARFVEQIKHKAQDGATVVLTMPKAKIAEECAAEYLEDLQHCGIDVDYNLTGSYTSRSPRLLEVGKMPIPFDMYAIVGKVDKRIQVPNDRPFTLRPEYKISCPSENSASNITANPTIYTPAYSDSFVRIGEKPKSSFGDDFFDKLLEMMGGQGGPV